MNPFTQFEREQWVYDLVVYGTLTEFQAEVFVRAKQGGSPPRIAGALGADRSAVKAAFWNAYTLAEHDPNTYLLILGPQEFHREPDRYPEVKEKALWALDPPEGVETMQAPQ